MRIGIDVSTLVFSKQLTGVERVLTEINRGLTSLLDSQKYEVEPFVTRLDFKKPEQIPDFLKSDPVFNKALRPIDSFDILFFGGINANLPIGELMRLKSERNVKMVALVHDILPITHPEWFMTPKFASGREASISSRVLFQFYLQASLSLADHLILTSQHVKNELMKFRWNQLPTISVLHLGAYKSRPVREVRPRTGINTLYVSTITIRKGHAELLSAFEILWAQGLDISLTLVGNRGWQIDDFISRLTAHDEYGRRLLWRQGLSDLEAIQLYGQSDISFITSEDEGFGLALEEGLANGVKVIARDIPVFQERSFPNLFFYNGGPKKLCEKILEVSTIPYEPLSAGRIRTMADFVADLAHILKAL